jgi:hypothetical protein
VKTAEPRNSTDHRSGLNLSVAPTNSEQLWWAPDAFGLIWKKEETLALIPKENGSENPAKPRISNRQLSGNSGTLLRRLSLSRSGALPMKGLELVLEKRRRSGALSPASALAIPQKTPPAMVLTHDQTHAAASIYSPLTGPNFLERHYVKTLKNSAGHRWVDRK